MGVEAPIHVPLCGPPRRVSGSILGGFGAIHWLLVAFFAVLILFAFYFFVLIDGSATGDPLLAQFLIALFATLAGAATGAIVLRRAYCRIRLTRWLCRAGIAVPGEVLAKRRGGPRRNIGLVRCRFLNPHTGTTTELEAEPRAKIWQTLKPGQPLNVLIDPRQTNAVIVYEFCRFTVQPIPTSGIAGETLPYQTPLPSYRQRMLKSALFAMLASTFFPIWTYWAIGKWEATGSRHIFWVAILAFPIHHPYFMRDVTTEYVVIFSLAAILGAGVGALITHLNRYEIQLRQSDEQ